MKESILAVRRAIDELDLDGIGAIVGRCLEEGLSPEEIIQEGISPGLAIVGQKFEEGEYFLADLIMAGEVVKEAMPLLKDRMNPGNDGGKGTVVLATVAGDIHEIGKNIVGMILSANGFEVIDLGVDVPAGKIMEAAQSSGARFIGLSALLTTMVDSIREVVDAARSTGLRDKVRIVIGGACTSQELCTEMGADAYGETAIDALRIFNGYAAGA
ncbi:MAG TPA: cobalamin-dependent protein [Flavobacteriales bacterium]|nr:cobalamin-dependent protein [Flavobacteriales bacterium]HPI92385.1 cobalamin-dependent protein [Deltaproteobacteria bacterium]HPR55072.1 cobalamin-dependent protein [Deltaproteobacteria bacterium]